MMSNLETALRINLFEEMENLPTEFEEYEHTESYNKSITRLFDKMRGGKLHRFTKKTAVVILVAAILFALLITGFAAVRTRNFTIIPFSDHFEYRVNNIKGSKNVKEISIGYIPEGFELEFVSGKTFKHYRYSNGDQHINIEKDGINSVVGYDTDVYDENVEINGVTYVYIYVQQYDIGGFLWNDGEYVYSVDGNIPKEELLKIALQTK
ncbi:MAG TPA: hypothetical protein DCR23_00540 [Ruminococcaceae bacterium]|nr:hypothetical protein [Oscillospiraceae bacterium]